MQLSTRTRSTRLLAVLGALAIALTVPVATAPAAQAATPYSLSSSTLLLELTNDYRKSKGLSGLRWNSGAAAVAQAWSEKMLAERKMYHNPNVFKQIPSGWTGAAENVGYACGYSSAAAAAKAIMTAWKKSSGHDKNLRGSYSDIGIGFAWDASTRCAYTTQDFAKYSGTPSSVSIFGKVTPAPGDPMSSLSGAKVVASGSGGTRSAAVDPATGSYVITDVPSGTYTLQVQTPNATNEYLTDAASTRCANRITLRSGDWLDVNVKLTDGTLSGPSSRIELCDVTSNSESSNYASNWSAIAWMADSGITAGYSNGRGAYEYRSGNDVDRGAMAAFLYRSAGSPAFKAPSVSPFTDLAPGSTFYKEITWLESEGITKGFTLANGSVEYRPHTSVNRGQMATFLYRMAGSPKFAAPATSPFSDLSTGSSIYTPVTWLAAMEISKGYTMPSGKPQFRSAEETSRGHMATFLKRFDTAVN